MEESFKRRIGYSGELEQISLQVCKDYGLGQFKSNHLILVGYEDFNFILETASGRYFVKVFANFRDMADCKRYVRIMEKAVEAGVATPRLYKSGQGYLHVADVGGTTLRLCVMEFIDGKTLFDLDYELNPGEIRFLAGQAALINSIAMNPAFVYDHWAITSFPKEFEAKSRYLEKDDLGLMSPLVTKFRELKIGGLPHCFVHGDIIATNVMKDDKGKLWVIDFAVSNYYPRIQELAVLACNLLLDKEDGAASERNLGIALGEYQGTVQLTKEELGALPAYIELAHAMHVLQASFQKFHENNQSRENEYWLNEGRTGLRQRLDGP